MPVARPSWWVGNLFAAFRRSERSDPGADAVRWTVASALDAFERLRGYSSYFSRPDITVGISNDLQSMGLRTAQMARRGAVAAVRLRMLQAAEGGAKS